MSTTIPQSWLALQEDIGTHALKPCIGYGCRDIFVLHVPFHIGQVHIEVYGHQQCHPLGNIAGVCNDTLYV